MVPRFLAYAFVYLSAVGALEQTRGQSCSDLKVQGVQQVAATPNQISAALAKNLHRSFLVEVYQPDEKRSVLTLPDGATVEDYARAVTDDPAAQCDDDGKTVHIYTTSVLRLDFNVLNHIFPGFSVPKSADLFLIALKQRLDREAFNLPGTLTSGSEGGAVSNDGGLYLLHPEVISSISARDLFLRESKAVPMLWAITFSKKDAVSKTELWKLAEQSMQLEVLR